MRRRVFPAILGGALALLPAALLSRAPDVPEAPEETSITAAELRAHLRFLASDQLAGRGVGHEGNALAELYIASSLERAGLTPGGPNGFFQPFDLYSAALGANNALRIFSGAEAARTTIEPPIGDEWYPLSTSASRAVSAPLAFVGYGITAPELNYDDYAGIDVAGRIVVALDHEPQETDAKSRFAGRERSEHAAARRKLANAQAHGAAGLILVPDAPKHTRVAPMRRAWPGETSVRDARYALADAQDRLAIPGAIASVAVAKDLLGTDGVEALHKKIDAALAKAGAALVQAPASVLIRDRQAALTVDLKRTRSTSRNVLATLGGATRPEEIVMVGAHLDHDGIDAAQRVYNGADDDGSGTVSVLEIAEAFARAAAAGHRPARTVVFSLWNAEEKGLLGSQYYVDTALQPAGRAAVVAYINLDMIGRNEEVTDPSDPRFRGMPKTSPAETANVVHLLGYSYSPDLASVVAEQNAGIGLTIKTDYDRHLLDLIRRSDHWPFLQRGVPALFFTTGLHPDYHTPQDDVESIDFEKMQRIARLTYRVMRHVADRKTPPRYVTPRTTEP